MKTLVLLSLFTLCNVTLVVMTGCKLVKGINAEGNKVEQTTPKPKR